MRKSSINGIPTIKNQGFNGNVCQCICLLDILWNISWDRWNHWTISAWVWKREWFIPQTAILIGKVMMNQESGIKCPMFRQIQLAGTIWFLRVSWGKTENLSFASTQNWQSHHHEFGRGCSYWTWPFAHWGIPCERVSTASLGEISFYHTAIFWKYYQT